MRAVAKKDAALLSTRWCRASRALDGGLRVAYLRSESQSHSLPRVAEALDEICAAAEQAEPEARELLVAVVDFLADRAQTEFSKKLREEAAGHSLLALARLLRRPIATPSLPPLVPNSGAACPNYGTGRTLT